MDTKRVPEKEEKVGFFQMVWQMLSGNSDPNRERRRLIKNIAKTLKKSHQKLYTPKNKRALPGLAKWFYEFYKTLGPARHLVEHADTSGALKAMLIESFLEPKHIELLHSFHEDTIKERIKYTDTKNLADELKEEIISFFSVFDAEKVKTINGTYNILQRFLDLIHFDFYFFIKKFDSSLPEGNFFYKPSYESINGEYIIDDLKDFLDVTTGMEKTVNWEYVLDILKEYKGGNDIVSRNGWKKLVRQMNQILKSKAFEHIIMHLDNNPYYKVTPHNPKNKIVEAYLSKLKTQTELTIQKIVHAKRSKNIDDLCIKIFGTSSVSRMKNYTEKANMSFKKKIMGGYIHVSPMNYLKAFLMDYNKKDIREIVDLLLVRGKWTTNLLSQQLSDVFQQLIETSDTLLQFDESLNDDSPFGSKMKTTLIRSDKDKKSARALRQMLKDTNDQAKRIIFDSAQALITLGKNLKQLLDDYSKSPHDLIINWKDIDIVTDGTTQQTLTDIYKKIYYFIKLLQFYNR